MSADGQDDLDIPAFLKRKPKSEVPMVKSEDVDVIEDADGDEAVEAPAKPRKAKVKANEASKPVKAAKAPAKAKGKAKPAKAKDAYGFGEGTLKSRAAAMYAHKKGATMGEVKDVLGVIQLNLLKQLEGRGYKVTRTKEKAGSRTVTRYHLSK